VGDDLAWRHPPANVTVMSYNLRGSHLDTEVNTWWHHRREVLAGSIVKYQPSIIGTQEGLQAQLLDLLSLLPSSWRLFGCSRRPQYVLCALECAVRARDANRSLCVQ
jgi:hypothetical protein